MAADVIGALGGSLSPKFRDIFDEDVSLNLPSDDMSKWLTQIVPIGFLAAHAVMIFIDTNDKGKCFVPTSTDGKRLTPSQVQYITDFCVSQVTHYACFEDDGTLKDDCKSNNTCHHNTSTFDPIHKDKRSTLYLYRYYFFFLFWFSFCHVIGQKFWKLLFASKIRSALESIVPLVKIRHAMKYGLASPDSQGATNSFQMEIIDRHVDAIKYRVFRNSKKTSWKRIFRSMSYAYVIRRVLGLCIDYQFLVIILALAKSNLINSEVFVCDLHRDRSNIYLCDTFTQQFFPCTISFELETQTTQLVFIVITALDTCLQLFTYCYWRYKFKRLKKMSFTLPYNAELQIDRNDQWSKFVRETVSFLYPTNDLMFVKVLYGQNNDKHDPFLKATVDKMFDEIFILQRTVCEQSEQNPNDGIQESEMEYLPLMGDQRPSL